jgi:enoyl-[acyl-carrier-protein] reductase (NADH)
MAIDFEELKRIQEKANKYENVKQRYVEFGDKLKKIIDALTEIRTEISPIIKGIGNSNKRGSHGEIMNELYEKMLSGTEVSTALIQASYGLDKRLTMYIYCKLSAMKNVLKRRDGKKRYLYIQKNI